MSHAIKAAIAFLLLLTAGCDKLERTVNSIAVVTAALDRLAGSVDLESQQWRADLAKTRTELVNAGHTAIANDLDLVVQRGIQAVGGETRCTIDFVRQRVGSDIRSLVARLTNKKVEPPEPQICDVVPSVIDLNIKPGSLTHLTVSGYDLDRTDRANRPMRLRLIPTKGDPRYIDGWLSTVSHYKQVIALQPTDLALLRGVQSLELSWNGTRKSAIKIIQPAIKRWEESLPVGAQSLVPPHKSGGDQDFDTGDDEAIKVVVWSQAKLEKGTVYVQTYMWAHEWNVKHDRAQDDYTFADGTSDWMAVKSEGPGQKFIRLVGNTSTGSQTYYLRKEVKNFDLPAGSLVRTFTITGDRDGPESGTYTGVTAHFHPIRVLVEDAP